MPATETDPNYTLPDGTVVVGMGRRLRGVQRISGKRGSYPTVHLQVREVRLCAAPEVVFELPNTGSQMVRLARAFVLRLGEMVPVELRGVRNREDTETLAGLWIRSEER